MLEGAHELQILGVWRHRHRRCETNCQGVAVMRNKRVAAKRMINLKEGCDLSGVRYRTDCFAAIMPRVLDGGDPAIFWAGIVVRNGINLYHTSKTICY